MRNNADRWGVIETPFSTFAAWVDDDGRVTRFNLRANRARAVDRDAVRDDRAIADVHRQILEYCQGKRKVFDLERSPAFGSAFQRRVWDALMQIPFGETASYGEVARAIGEPGAARAVGAANAVNPISIIVPCHRVIGSDGSLTGYGGGMRMKQSLLAHEARYSARPNDLFAVG